MFGVFPFGMPYFAQGFDPRTFAAWFLGPWRGEPYIRTSHPMQSYPPDGRLR